MIVVEEPNSAERAPLKSNPDPASQAPPPPYAATATLVEQYRSVRAVPPPSVAVVVVERESPLQRFLKAFAVALIIIFLWSMFIDSMNMAVGRRNRHRGTGSTYEDEEPGLEWHLRDWYKTAPASTPCLCSTADVSTSEIVRALPIQYPPTPSPQVEMALPSVAPTSVPQEP